MSPRRRRGSESTCMTTVWMLMVCFMGSDFDHAYFVGERWCRLAWHTLTYPATSWSAAKANRLRPWPTFKSALRKHYVYLSFADGLSHQELRSKLRFSGRGPVSSAVVQYSREANTGQNQTAPAYGFHICVQYVTI